MKNSGNLLLVLLLVSGVAAACAMVASVVTPVIKVSAYQTQGELYREIGDKLGAMYGTQFKEKEILSLRVPVMVCVLGVCGVTADVQTLKPCGQTIEQRMDEVAILADILYGTVDGGGGLPGDCDGGLAGEPTNPYQYCAAETIKSCIDGGTNCRYDTYLICPSIT